MPQSDRELGRHGPLFFKDGDTVMFQYGVDANNVSGPYKATESDKAQHKGAWETFAASQSQGDHHPASDGDGDGQPGGSLPESREVEKAVEPVRPKRKYTRRSPA